MTLRNQWWASELETMRPGLQAYFARRSGFDSALPADIVGEVSAQLVNQFRTRPKDYPASWRAAKTSGIDYFVIYGNHDVWPGPPPRIPCQANQKDLDSRRSALRSSANSSCGREFHCAVAAEDTWPCMR